MLIRYSLFVGLLLALTFFPPPSRADDLQLVALNSAVDTNPIIGYRIVHRTPGSVQFEVLYDMWMTPGWRMEGTGRMMQDGRATGIRTATRLPPRQRGTFRLLMTEAAGRNVAVVVSGEGTVRPPASGDSGSPGIICSTPKPLEVAISKSSRGNSPKKLLATPPQYPPR